MASTKSRVVIIGGGFAGCKVAKLLAADASMRVTLIDPKEFFEIVIAHPRALVLPEWGQRSILPYSSFLAGVHCVKGQAASIDAKKVVTDTGQVVEFDYCVVAVGSSYAGFLKAAPTTSTAAQRLSELHALSVKLKGASQVLVVGGGPSGVELAFEILDTYPSKKVPQRSRVSLTSVS